MTHRTAWIVAALLLATAAGRAAAQSPNPAAPRPNIVLCMTDDQGWGDVSYNGLTKIRTPNLDRMAAEGLRFDRFYAQQSCSPTRASVVSGRHPNRLGVFWPGMPLRRQEITIAQAVKTAGYVSGHFGKWHLNAVAGPGKPIAASDPLGPLGVGFDESFSVTNYFECDWTFSHNGKPVKVAGEGSEAIVAAALKFMGAAAAEKKPFLALVWFGSPHGPHKPLPADLAAAGGSGYYGEILGVDRAMGNLRAGLRKLGIAENTLVWFCSDNGGWLDPNEPNAHGTNNNLRGRKGDMWEGGIRVPCVLEWPAGVKQPLATSMPAGVVDIYPTVVELVGACVPNQVQPLDGISLVPLLAGQMKERPRPLGFWQFDETQPGFGINSGPSAWSDNRYKLHRRVPDEPAEHAAKPAKRPRPPKPHHFELYDLIEDIGETKDIAAEHPDVVARMKAELEGWQESVVRSHRGEDYPEKKVIQPERPKTKPAAKKKAG